MTRRDAVRTGGMQAVVARGVATTAALLLIAAVVGVVGTAPAEAVPVGTITTVASDISSPVGIAAGFDGNLWFTSADNDSIGRITPSGVVSDFTGSGVDSPAGIVAGPDGNIWFTNWNSHSIGRITPTGVVSNFIGPGISNPEGITAGPDGNLWFTNPGSYSIGRITPSGIVENFTHASINGPSGITAGPDGNLWFTNSYGSSIGQITPAGVVSNFTGIGISNPEGIAAGFDGNVWFTNRGNDSIGRITPAGVVSNFTGIGISNPEGIAAGSDGNVWFTNQGNDSIGRITPTGVVTTFTDSGVSSPRGITSGPDLNVWFTNPGSSSIGRIVAMVCGVDRQGPFGDVGGAHPFCTEINWLAANGTTTGYADGTFHPTAPLSRQAMASFLYAQEGQPAVTISEPNFADVPASHPFYAAIQWMADSGLSLGSPNPLGGKPLFKPGATVSRQAMASFLWRKSGEPTPTITSQHFGDVSSASPFHAAIQWLAEAGLSLGSPNPPGLPLYKPTDAVSRQATAAFLFRYEAL